MAERVAGCRGNVGFLAAIHFKVPCAFLVVGGFFSWRDIYVDSGTACSGW